MGDPPPPVPFRRVGYGRSSLRTTPPGISCLSRFLFVFVVEFWYHWHSSRSFCYLDTTTSTTYLRPTVPTFPIRTYHCWATPSYICSILPLITISCSVHTIPTFLEVVLDFLRIHFRCTSISLHRLIPPFDTFFSTSSTIHCCWTTAYCLQWGNLIFLERVQYILQTCIYYYLSCRPWSRYHTTCCIPDTATCTYLPGVHYSGYRILPFGVISTTYVLFDRFPLQVYSVVVDTYHTYHNTVTTISCDISVLWWYILGHFWLERELLPFLHLLSISDLHWFRCSTITSTFSTLFCPSDRPPFYWHSCLFLLTGLVYIWFPFFWHSIYIHCYLPPMGPYHSIWYSGILWCDSTDVHSRWYRLPIIPFPIHSITILPFLLTTLPTYRWRPFVATTPATTFPDRSGWRGILLIDLLHYLIPFWRYHTIHSTFCDFYFYILFVEVCTISVWCIPTTEFHCFHSTYRWPLIYFSPIVRLPFYLPVHSFSGSFRLFTILFDPYLPTERAISVVDIYSDYHRIFLPFHLPIPPCSIRGFGTTIPPFYITFHSTYDSGLFHSLIVLHLWLHSCSWFDVYLFHSTDGMWFHCLMGHSSVPTILTDIPTSRLHSTIIDPPPPLPFIWRIHRLFTLRLPLTTHHSLFLFVLHLFIFWLGGLFLRISTDGSDGLFYLAACISTFTVTYRYTTAILWPLRFYTFLHILHFWPIHHYGFSPLPPHHHPRYIPTTVLLQPTVHSRLWRWKPPRYVPSLFLRCDTTVLSYRCHLFSTISITIPRFL